MIVSKNAHSKVLPAAWIFVLTLATNLFAQVPAPNATPKPAANQTAATTAKRGDPQMQAVLDSLASLNAKPIETLEAEEAKQQPTVADAVKNLLKKRGMPDAPEPVGRVEDRQIDGDDGKIAARIYAPAGKGPFPVIVYYHGGGWVIATIDTYDASARALTNAAGAIVVSVEYRKGPENKFPVAHDDAFAAYRWTLANAASFGGDTSQIAVAGESAGGNLATVACLIAKEQGGRLPAAQLLIYPAAKRTNGLAAFCRKFKRIAASHRYHSRI